MIVVGAGAAGLAAAIEACAAGVHAVLVSKHIYQHTTFRWSSTGGCVWKTNAFNAAVGEGDSAQLHLSDTLASGDGSANPRLASRLCEDAPSLIPWLEAMGMTFDRTETGALLVRPYGGCSRPRAVYRDDRLGFFLHQALWQRTKALAAEGLITILEGYRARQLMLSEHGAVDGLCCIESSTQQLVAIDATAVVIADGGGATMYSPSAASADKTCDGMRLALDAGVELVDMEFVQFHPTGLASPVAVYSGALIGENARFNGALLVNASGRAFMEDYDPRGERATRDVVSRGIFSEIRQGRGHADDSVSMDLTACREEIRASFPALEQRLRHAGFDLRTTSVIRVKPTAHFLMGGIRIDDTCATSMPGLFAAGESAGGIHGANRLGGNGVTDALVFGRIAGRSGAARACSHVTGQSEGEVRVQGPLVLNGGEDQHPAQLLETLRAAMYDRAGPVREKSELLGLQSFLLDLDVAVQRSRIPCGASASEGIQRLLDLQSLMAISHVIVGSALRRAESRGSHFRSDYPLKSKLSVGNAVAKHPNGTLAWSQYVQDDGGYDWSRSRTQMGKDHL